MQISRLSSAGSIRDKTTFDKRAKAAALIRNKFPSRLPVICERGAKSDLPIVDKRKFLVPCNMLVGEFKYILTKYITAAAVYHKIELSSELTIYLFVNNTTPKAGTLMQEVYDQHADQDGFLYLQYSGENTLGGYSMNIYISSKEKAAKEGALPFD